MNKKHKMECVLKTSQAKTVKYKIKINDVQDVRRVFHLIGFKKKNKYFD